MFVTLLLLILPVFGAGVAFGMHDWTTAIAYMVLSAFLWVDFISHLEVREIGGDDMDDDGKSA